jgi:hypothetical protein
MSEALQKKLEENTEWMIVNLSLSEKIGFIAPVKIDIDDNFSIWTLTLFGGHKVVSGSLEEAVNVAIRFVNK